MHRRILTLFLLLLASVLSACDMGGSRANNQLKYVPPPTQPPTEPPRPTATNTVYTEPATPTAPPPLALDTAKVKAQLAKIEADTARMRGLKALHPVPENFISKDQIAYNMEQVTLKEYTHEMALREATRLWLLMFIDDPTIDLRQLEIDFSGKEILGYYDHRAKDLYVRTDGASLDPRSQETLAHEFVHNLQDQHFDLQKILPDNIDNDRGMAVRALVEGDATVSGIMYASRFMSRGDFNRIFDNPDEVEPPVPGRAPVYLREGWLFPYREGTRFVMNLGEPNSYKAVNQAFLNPPRSTEQVMHPEKYLTDHPDEPMPVALPPLTDTLGAGWTFVESDTLGEFDLSVMLRENYMETPEATDGWGGARYALYKNGNAALVIMGSVWDTKKDAQEFETGLEASFKLFQQYGGLWNDSRRVFGVKRSADQIVFVCGTDRSAVQRVLASLQP